MREKDNASVNWSGTASLISFPVEMKENSKKHVRAAIGIKPQPEVLNNGTLIADRALPLNGKAAGATIDSEPALRWLKRRANKVHEPNFEKVRKCLLRLKH